MNNLGNQWQQMNLGNPIAQQMNNSLNCIPQVQRLKFKYYNRGIQPNIKPQQFDMQHLAPRHSMQNLGHHK